jgi:tRNA nucleotidyltransferase (CCA-adding enzyme)
MTVTYYKVGGCVRDRILGVRSKDIDYAVEAASYEDMRDDVLRRGATIFVEHPEYQTIRAKMDGEDADFVLCRKDGEYSDGRRPDSVTIGTIDDDLARRDFTMNAIAQREDGTLYDPFGGQRAIALKLIECVGDTYDRFNEDALRILRAIRFHITKEFSMSHEIQAAMYDYNLLDKLVDVAAERVREEVNKCLTYSTPHTLDLFNEYKGLSAVVFGHPRIRLQIHLQEAK